MIRKFKRWLRFRRNFAKRSRRRFKRMFKEKVKKS